jgi:predicted XRE-type DNA-binding protein
MINEKPLDYGDALLSLRPNSVWVIEDNDLDNIRWEDNNQDIPTKQEIKQELEKLIEKRKADIAEQELVKKSAVEKLAKLGLTEEEAKAIIGL